MNGQETETLFGGATSHGGFGAPVIKISDVAGEPGIWVGGRGAWIISLQEGHALSLGGGGFGLATDHEITDPDFGVPGTDYFVNIGYGGFEIEYYNRSNRLVHYTVSTMVGGGSLSARDRNDREYGIDPDQFFLFETGANVEINITEFFRISGGLGYRFINNISTAGFSESDFFGLTGTLTFKFGQLRW